MQRTKIGDTQYYFIAASGIKRIARARKNRVSDVKISPHIEKSMPLRKVTGSKNGVVVVLHIANGKFGKSEQDILYIAQALAKEQPVLAVCFGNLDLSVLTQGADRVLLLKAQSWQQYQPQAKLKLLNNIKQAQQPKHFLFANNIDDIDLARRFACSNQLSFATNIAEINNDTAKILVKSASKQQEILTPTIMCLGSGLSYGELEYNCEAIPYKIPNSIKSDAKQVLSQTKNQEISLEQADFICAAGNGISNIKTFLKFTSTLDAAIGASRVVVDDGKFTKSQQVGTTGVSVQSNIYVAVGISGAIQHLQGIETCNKVVAINTDPNCQMVKRAMLSIIHDANELMAEVIQIMMTKNA